MLYNMRLAFGASSQAINQEFSNIKWGFRSLEIEEEKEIEELEKDMDEI